MWCFLLLTLFVTVQGRAVNISNTWVLPEEGFPVFYRYFRDRISWYEADAVCQFHHANLVTVDTTAQYDAVRAYLKELDISSAVWVGLIRSNPDGDFTWTDYRGLSGDGYWSSAPDARSAPLCAAADPTADYRWEARACGGPSVASFICELPGNILFVFNQVPQWALGNEGCMVRALPALTILYLPESAAVQLTTDCGLAGVKRVQCTGNMKRENLLKDLSCTDDDQTSTLSMPTSPAIFWQTTTDKVISDQEYINEVTSDDNSTTEHEDDINQSMSTKLLPSTDFVLSTTETFLQKQSITVKQISKLPLQKNVNINIINDNNLHSNDIPNPAGNDDFFNNEQTEILEDEKNMQHKKLHDELARLGNFEKIFSQPADHFVPPLVMAKAKISDDMTALSIEEKLAQQLAERQFMRHNNLQSDSSEMTNDTKTGSVDTVLKEMMTENPLINVLSSTKISDAKYGVPKKYNKHDDIKLKIARQNIKSPVPIKISNIETSTQANLTADNNDLKATIKTITQRTYDDQKSDDDSSLELTVIIKEPEHNIDKNKTKMNGPNFNISGIHQKSMNIKKSVSSVPIGHHVIMNDEVIKIEIINEKGNNHSDIDITVYEVTTKIPVVKENPNINENINMNISQHDFISMPTTFKPSTLNDSTSSSVNDLITASIRNSVTENINKSDGQSTEGSLITIITDLNVDSGNDSIFDYTGRNVFDDVLPSSISVKETNDSLNDTDLIEHLERNDTSQTPEIDDLNSPLLSAASEPLHKPNRSRRPQSQNRGTKFNPFRILG